MSNKATTKTKHQVSSPPTPSLPITQSIAEDTTSCSIKKGLVPQLEPHTLQVIWTTKQYPKLNPTFSALQPTTFPWYRPLLRIRLRKEGWTNIVWYCTAWIWVHIPPLTITFGWNDNRYASRDLPGIQGCDQLLSISLIREGYDAQLRIGLRVCVAAVVLVLRYCSVIVLFIGHGSWWSAARQESDQGAPQALRGMPPLWANPPAGCVRAWAMGTSQGQHAGFMCRMQERPRN